MLKNDRQFFVHRFLHKNAAAARGLFNLGILMVLGCTTLGCDSKQPTPSVSNQPSVSNPSKPSSQESEATNAPQVAEATPGQTTNASGSDASAQKPSSTKELTKAPEQPAPKPVVKKPVAQPTPELLARWEKSPFEPLKLLACREDSVGLVATTASTLDGKNFVLGGAKLTLWSPTSEKAEHVFRSTGGSDSDPIIISLATSADGQWFAAGDSKGTLQTWRLEDRKELASQKIYPNGVSHVAISPDGQEIATIHYDSEVAIWNAEKLTGKKKFKVNTNGIKRILYVAPNVLAVAGESTTLWNTSTGKLEKTLSPGRYHYTMGLSPDGNVFAFGEEKGLQLWDVAKSEKVATISGAVSSNDIIAFSPDSKYIACTSKFMIRIWDIAQARVVQVIDTFGWNIVGTEWLRDSNALMIVDEIGRTRVWGNAATANSMQLQPMHAEVSLPESNSRVPATPAQILAAFDVRVFPNLEGASPTFGTETTMEYNVSVPRQEAVMYFSYYLGKAGWEELPPSDMSPGQTLFRKNGMTLSVSVRENGKDATINLVSLGNFDTRWLPKADISPVEVMFENESISMYQLKAELLPLEIQLLRKMNEAGWTAYSRLNASHREEPDSRSLEFIQNGTLIHISLSKSPKDPAGCMVQCSKVLNVNTLPIPRDCGFVEFDGSTQPYLVANTKLSFDEAMEFYDTQLVAQGWLKRERLKTVDEDHRILTYLRGQQDLVVYLSAAKDGRTWVRVGDKLENSSWQLEKPKKEETAKPTMEAADFPVLNESKKAKFDLDGKTIDMEFGKVKLADIAEQYTQELAKSGWIASKSGVKSDDYTMVIFEKERAEITLRARQTDGNATVNVQGDGLVWSKPLPGGKQITSYEAWLRQNKHRGTLELLEQFEKEMKAISK